MKFAIAFVAGFLAPTFIAVAAFGAEAPAAGGKKAAVPVVQKLDAESMKPHAGGAPVFALSGQAPTKTTARK